MLVRLMQNFSSISLELDSFLPGSLPPEEFKPAPGKKGIDKIWLKVALGLYINACVVMHTGWRTFHSMSSFRADFGSRCRRLMMHNAFVYLHNFSTTNLIAVNHGMKPSETMLILNTADLSYCKLRHL